MTVAHMEPQGTAHSIGEEAKPLGTAVGMAAARPSRGFPIWYECSTYLLAMSPCCKALAGLRGLCKTHGTEPGQDSILVTSDRVFWNSLGNLVGCNRRK